MEARALIRQNGEAGATGVTGPVPWWSLTKTVLAIALLRLWETDKIDLDARVEGKPYTPANFFATKPVCRTMVPWIAIMQRSRQAKPPGPSMNY